MALNPGMNAVEGGLWCQARNATGGTIIKGTGVILSAVVLPSPVAGVEPGTTGAAFEFVLPSGSTTTQASLGILLDDCASGDICMVMLAGIIAARSDGSSGVYLTLDALGRLKAASTGSQVLALQLGSPVGGACWCRVVPPFLI